VKPFPPEIVAALDGVLESLVETHGVPGAIAGVWLADDASWVRARGVADLATGRPMRPDDCMRIASITKSFIATLVLQLADDGRLRLQDPLTDHFPELPGAAAISIDQLLNHTSGLPEYIVDEEFKRWLREEPQRERQPQELLALALRPEPSNAPGVCYNYSNTNYLLAGLMIENITGRRLKEVLEERILQPLGLVNTELPESMPQADCVRGYMDGADGSLREAGLFHPSLIWAAGGMISDLSDLRRWAVALARGELLSGDAVKAQQTWVEQASEQVRFVRYGLGVSAIFDWIGHEGGFLGYNSAAYHHPGRGATIVVLLNRAFPERSVAGESFLYLGKAACPEICE
jgi:D-alanyl-D-alanine carboxypeptidase